MTSPESRPRVEGEAERVMTFVAVVDRFPDEDDAAMEDRIERSAYAMIQHAPFSGFDGVKFYPGAITAEARLDLLTAEVERLTRAKDGAYGERNALVVALSKLFPASLERHPAEEEWDDDWRWIVFIDLPTGQATWHIHDIELPYFAHLARDTGRKWDGHSTPEKYARLAALSLPTPAPEATE